MKKTYTEEVFHFFTADEERFKMMGQIAQHEPKVRTKLIQDFWTKLKDTIKAEFEARNEDWIVDFSNEFSSTINKVMIYRKSWCFDNYHFPLVSAAFERLHFGKHPFIGILVDRSGYGGKKKKYDTEGIKGLIRRTQSFIDLGVHPKNKWWPVMRETHVNLKSYDTMVNILPANEAKTIDSLLQEAIIYAETLDDFMKKEKNLIRYKL